MGSFLRGMRRGVRLHVIVLAMMGMTIDVFSNPFTSDLVLHRIYAVLDFPDADPESDDTPPTDASALATAVLTSSDAAVLPTDETVALRPHRASLCLVRNAAPGPLKRPVAPHFPTDLSSHFPPSLSESHLCRFLC